MPNSASAKKRLRQDGVRRQRNRVHNSSLRSQLRKFREADTVEAMEVAMPSTVRALDMAASRGIIHQKQASRKKKRLALRLNKAKAGS